MINGIDVEVLLASGYAVFLMVLAATLELLARHSHHRSERMRLGGFEYHADLDHWKCPMGQHLNRVDTDHVRSIALYRAPAHACNACGIKGNCTDSDDGREIEHHRDSWLSSEIRRFHRGVSLTLLLLAGLVLATELLHYTRPRDVWVLGSVLTPLGVVGARLLVSFSAK
jgi:hypothetical protein